ncbi:UDP-N-acetylmuramate:L-alanyl-gamma-D-glutamyl-meso-diaminopimelate ligase [Methylicorpusculum sp.]|uniref:UDP-N-acetylmuramate:L-alanyl-gamma-D-glutamyl- meso-diaminopimelate ligase n=1 Tax=Methylicorpusculum sp. TaxID=2713644 RepID=UPI0027302D16|nr:UDP-N-acetylmuramate:L-alanyl-gamma-D-glutamyl-meso-diaminopimelate ligase [Methylicorpusculum sp.]MDP2177320.1 UDP-N-acetylmuramate:L-alanyl-gamma-D-glutamyl-meso-diaminopimelate ligase [Methylicorpusculum sp.]MDP3531033.1 UDP-N-acetylmuramate:L-alanyl-gamma-D-glutamyl-meso-diaminopimelate ligase [Methylicorpusculum sp.]MDZ4153787.1 UDP-N-acetylmuramate:L-alanyl-gamma-D-glutamyl-meso-diaminopimelate ligase [Methylicorpusculum sp.]
MHIHILGICGTFMGGLALIARALGHQVSGSDQNVYPPMSTQLEEQGILLMEGYSADNIKNKPDLVIIGNALSRGNPEVEAVLNAGLRYLSGPQWLAEHVLQDKWVLGVAGTHGKTTTTSMLSWILECQGFNPGFLIGGIPLNFGISARLGESSFFVIEADEYDSAFFDKRSKFVHYRPRTAILNNLEFDHADIFPDLDAIKKQFHHLVRTIPSEGLIIAPGSDANVGDVLTMGCWTPVQLTSVDGEAQWNAALLKEDGSQFLLYLAGKEQGLVDWSLTGDHNVYNALSAVAAAHHVGIHPADAITALSTFKNVKRRMEVLATIKGVTLYDDFAHHPTAIQTTLDGLRKQVGNERIIAIVEPRSNTMRLGIHTRTLAESLNQADLAIIYQPENLNWDLTALTHYANNILICPTVDEIIAKLKFESRYGGHFVLMSNGSFGGIYQRLLNALSES